MYNQQETRTAKHNHKRRRPEGLKTQLKELRDTLEKIDPSMFYGEDVLKLTGKPSLYDSGATLMDKEELLSVKLVFEGPMPALHARWQRSGVIQGVSDAESEALTRAKFVVEDYRDEMGPFCYWRERNISHAWVILSQGGWRISRSRALKSAEWGTLTLSDCPVVPSLPGCPHNHRTVLRDGLIEAKVKLSGILPRRILEMEEYEEAMLALWSDAVERVERTSTNQQSAAV